MYHVASIIAFPTQVVICAGHAFVTIAGKERPLSAAIAEDAFRHSPRAMLWMLLVALCVAFAAQVIVFAFKAPMALF
jgi:hypothetical protein